MQFSALNVDFNGKSFVCDVDRLWSLS